MDAIQSAGLVGKIVSIDVLDCNKVAFQYMDRYKKTISILERTSAVLGKKVVYKSTSASTLNGKINLNAIGSTR